jgi:predicted GNAT superfamily acetyltransferase
VAAIAMRPLASMAECQQAYELQTVIWGADGAVPTPQMVVARHIGGLVLGAFAGERLVGFSFGLPALDRDEPYLWSDILAVDPAWRGQGLGKDLKWAQRSYALQMGYRHIRWTYDPLQAVNARLNIGALGATVCTYSENHYGDMNDDLNRGVPSDRLVADWDLNALTVAHLAEGGAAPGAARLPGAPWLTVVEPGDLPRLVQVEPDAAGPLLLCAIPEAWGAIRRDDPEGALRWRLATREALQAAFRRGYAITGVAPAAPGLAAYMLTQGS